MDPNLSTASELPQITADNDKTTFSSAEQKSNVNVPTTFDVVDDDDHQYSPHALDPNPTSVENVTQSMPNRFLTNTQKNSSKHSTDDKTVLKLQHTRSHSVPTPPMLRPAISIGSLPENKQSEIIEELISQHEKSTDKAAPTHIICSNIKSDDDEKLVRPKLVKVRSKGNRRKIAQRLHVSREELIEYSNQQFLSNKVEPVDLKINQFQLVSSSKRSQQCKVFCAKMATRENMLFFLACVSELMGVGYGIYELYLDSTSVLGLSLTCVYGGLFILTVLVKWRYSLSSPIHRLGSSSPQQMDPDDNPKNMVAH